MNLDSTYWELSFRSLMAHIGESAILADQEGNILLLNGMAESMFEIKTEQVRSKGVADIFQLADEKGEEIPQTSFGNVSRQKTVSGKAGLYTSSGYKEQVDYTISCIRDDVHEGCAYLILIKKVEENGLRENELRESERKYKGLFENALEGIFILDDNSNIIDANPAACSIYGISKREFMKIQVKTIFPHKTTKESDQIWQGFMKAGFLAGLYKYKQKSGDVRYIDFKARTSFLPGLHLAVFSDVTERMLAEKALRNSEANLQAIFNNTSQRIILLDVDLKIVTVNRRAQEVIYTSMGKNLEIGENILSYYDSPALRKHFNPLFEKVRKGEIVVDEFNFREGYWIEISLIPVFDSKKSVRGICLITVDITYRKQAQLMLEQSEARFRSLVQNSSDIITILDEDGKVTYSSPSSEKILGYKGEALSGKFFEEFIHSNEVAAFRGVMKKVLGAPGKVNSFEYRFLHARGFYLNMETTFNNLTQNEHIKGIILNSRDITERKYQEENLRLLERGIDASKNGIIISDPNQPDNPIIYANKAFEQITGYSYNEIIGKNCRFLQNGDHKQPDLEKVRQAIKNEKEVAVILRNYKKNGKLFWNQLNISPVYNKAGALTNFIGVLDDITERKIAEDTLIEITQGISGGRKDFYISLAHHLANSFHMDFVIIGEREHDKIKTRVFLKDGEIQKNIEFPVKGSPAEIIFEKGHCILIENTGKKFPQKQFPVKQAVDEFMGVPLLDSMGKKIGIIGVMCRKKFQSKAVLETLLNIFSVRAAAELERDHNIAALKQSELKFRNLAQNSPDLIYIIDLYDKRVVYFNRKTILGYDTTEFEFSDTWNAIVHPDDRKRVLAHWGKFLKSSGKTESMEYRMKRKTGEYEWVVNRHTIIERNQGKPCQVLLNLTIITERKKAEVALKESEARLMTLIENTSDIIWSVDRDLNLTTMNSAFKKLFRDSVKKNVAIGDNLKNVLPDDIREEWVKLHNKALNGDVFSTEFNLPAKNKNLSYEISYNPIYSEDRVSGVSVFARDITQRKIAENDIIRTNFELDSFVYRASHDLRAPLRSVLGLSNLAKMEEDSDQRNNFLSLIDKSVNKLDTFIADLTNFSRNSRLDVTIQKIEFDHILQETIDNLKYMDNAGTIDLKIKIRGKYEFYSDSTRLSIIIQNMISNCIKYQNSRVEKSWALVDIRIEKNKVVIQVKDNGKGIKEEYLDKIFNMFFRASQDSYGSGLGLYITKQVVEKLGGSIDVSSILGEGTEFTITLPNLKK
ncbi:MAG: PAS domain S-box protein [Cytophagaceae bacterium]